MDNYEEYLLQKIKSNENEKRNRKKELYKKIPSLAVDELLMEILNYINIKREIDGELGAYNDALMTYEELESKGKI